MTWEAASSIAVWIALAFSLLLNVLPLVFKTGRWAGEKNSLARNLTVVDAEVAALVDKLNGLPQWRTTIEAQFTEHRALCDRRHGDYKEEFRAIESSTIALFDTSERRLREVEERLMRAYKQVAVPLEVRVSRLEDREMRS